MSRGRGARRLGGLPSRILTGAHEPIFDILPERILQNLRSPRSENALLWNLVYPLARPTISLRSLLAIKPLWGTSHRPGEDEGLEPYFWGWNVAGERLGMLDSVLGEIDGPGPQTEVDLFLLGSSSLILVEAKHLGRLGQCARYLRGTCLEVHGASERGEAACRYWNTIEAGFTGHLDFGPRPVAGDEQPPCSLHYQLGRTLLVGECLARRLQRELHLWLATPSRRWPALERAWSDFADRVLDEGLWRRLRVIGWESVGALGKVSSRPT